MDTSIVLTIAVLAGLALVLGLVVTLVNKTFAVTRDPLADQLFDELPGVNCGACGCAGCEAYANALACGEITDTTRCTPGGSRTARVLAELLGQESQDFVDLVASVKCQGSCAHTKTRGSYEGIMTCAAAEAMQKGPGSCQYGCLGLGDCMRACPYDAIRMVNGVAEIDADKCVGCKKCVVACPKLIIHMIPKHKKALEVRCSNPLPSSLVKKVCTVGCIGCRRCEQVCPKNAITMVDSLAMLDQDLCIRCGKCVGVCPTGAITMGLNAVDIAQNHEQQIEREKRRRQKERETKAAASAATRQER